MDKPKKYSNFVGFGKPVDYESYLRTVDKDLINLFLYLDTFSGGTATDSLQISYDGGQTIDETTIKIPVTISTTSTAISYGLLHIAQQNPNGGNAAYIEQYSQADSMVIYNYNGSTCLSLYSTNGYLASNNVSNSMLELFNDNRYTRPQTDAIEITMQYGSGMSMSVGTSTTSSGYGIWLSNSGRHKGIYVGYSGIISDGNYALEVESLGAAGAQTSSNLVHFAQGHANTNKSVLELHNSGSGYSLDIYKQNQGTNTNIVSLGSGLLLALKSQASLGDTGNSYAISTDIKHVGTPANSYFAHCSGYEVVAAAVGGSNTIKLRVEHSGTAYFIPLYTA
jgi:hypothetical protein